MALPVRNFDQIVEDQKVALQVAQPLFNLTPGSDILALAEANAGLALYLQYLVYRVLKSTRLATAEGADVDSFGGDFLFARYPAVSATGQVVFRRFTAPNALNIPVNTIVRTQDNANSYLVVVDQNNPAYNPLLNAYVMDIGVMSVSVLVRSVIPGTIGNVAANTIIKLGSSLAIGTLSNPAPFVNGVDEENDDTYRTRFQLYINTRSRATVPAIQNAIINTQTGLTYTIEENIDASGNFLAGNILIYVNDGSASPPALLIQTLQENVELVRPAAVSFSLEPATVVPVSIVINTAWLAGFNRNNYVGSVGRAVQNYINSLSVGESLFLTRLYQVIYDSVPGLQDVFGVSINGVAQDLTIKPSEVARFVTTVPANSELVVSLMVID